MYLSTLFLSEIANGVEYAITKCNEEFLRRFGTIHDFIPFSCMIDSAGKVVRINSPYDEMMALWDVFKDFKEEVFIELSIIKAMNTICAMRNQMGRALEI